MPERWLDLLRTPTIPCGLDGGSSQVGTGWSRAVEEVLWHIRKRQPLRWHLCFYYSLKDLNLAIVCDAGHRLRLTRLEAALLSIPPPQMVLVWVAEAPPSLSCSRPRPTLDWSA